MTMCGVESNDRIICHYEINHISSHSWEINPPPLSKALAAEARSVLGMEPTFMDDTNEYYLRAFLNDHVMDVDPPTDEDVEHFKVLLRSLLKFHERDAKHKGLWRYFGAIDSAFQTRAKATRSYNVAIQLLRDPDAVLKEGLEDALDDPVDLINYAVFFIRNVEEGRFG